MVKVEIKCSGYGQSYWETVQLTKEDLEKCAIEKLREKDSSPNMEPISTTLEIEA